MHENSLILERRIERTLRERIDPARITSLGSVTVRCWDVPEDEGVVGEPIRFSELPKDQFEDIEIGTSWGKPWQTSWFELTVQIPAKSEVDLRNGDRLEVVFDLGWFDHSAGFQAEGIVRDENGRAIKAINPKNRWIPVRQPEDQPQTQKFYIEAAANPLLLAVPPFQVTEDGDKLTSGQEPIYRLAQADLVVLHKDVYDLALDLAVLRELAATLPEDDGWGWKIKLTLSEALDQLDLDDIPATSARAREVLKPILETPAYSTAHELSAIGHAHIDSAWLWPIRETRRKVTRTIANVVRLIEDGSGLVFALPAAQHVKWLQEEDPDLFERVKQCVKDGAIVPVGGMWIEPDAVLPGGEAMCRQLVEGLSFFEDELGVTCEEIWLPDSFGYSASIPQIARLAGIKRFFTQKISWNQVDKFPHHTLWWEGIDGSRIFTHFPPADTYGSEVTGENLDHAVKNFKDKGRTNCSMLPFGYGDGGGGPTREMIERINRNANLAASPKIKIESPQTFFEKAQREYPNAPVWVGELYLELHRGTFTSQIATKQGNRRSEALLREAELWATLAHIRAGLEYPYEELQETWRKVLLCQFHDILPGTSIAWVYREVAKIYEAAAHTCNQIIERSLAALAEGDQRSVANASSFNCLGVPALSAAPRVEFEPVGCAGGVLENENIRAEFDDSGYLTALIDRESGRDFVPDGQRGGELHIHQDFPNMWDAWDLDPFYRGSKQVVDDVEVVAKGCEGGVGFLTQKASFGKSSAEITWSLRPGARALDVHVDLDWEETEKILKLAFPVDIHTDRAKFETQMGYITRATHENTSWDAYRFEVSCHRWLQLEDAADGFAVANDSTYGWDVTRHAGERGTWSQVRASLARAAQFPDPRQDKGQHEWNFRLVPGADVLDAVREGQQINLPMRETAGAISPLFDLENAVVESVHMAPDRSGDVIIRAYEAQGGRARARLKFDGAKRVQITDLRYRPLEELAATGGAFEFDLSPFQIVTLRAEVAK